MTPGGGWFALRHAVIPLVVQTGLLSFLCAEDSRNEESAVTTANAAGLSSEPKIAFSDTAALPYGILRERLKERTTDLIRAEVRDDSEAVSAAMQALGRALQDILDRSCHPESPQASPVVERAARDLAIHLDRLDYARAQGDLRSLSRAIGTTSARVSELDKLLERVAAQWDLVE